MVGAGPTIFVILAVYRPDMAFLERQITSVLDQHGCNVRICLIADGPMPQLAVIGKSVEQDDRLSLTVFAENRGPAETFLGGLDHALSQPHDHAQERWFAFCDQDDVWHPDKLATSFQRLTQSQAACVHSDARLVDADLNLIAPSMFEEEAREHYPSLTARFFRNNATGMTMLFDEALARQVAGLRHLRPSLWLHDHFTAFIAAAGRGLAFEERALVDYVQHGGNAVGAGRIRFTWPRFAALNPQGEAARELGSGAELIRALLADAAGTRAELERLHRLLTRRGLPAAFEALRILSTINDVPRRMLVRLLWSKLAR